MTKDPKEALPRLTLPAREPPRKRTHAEMAEKLYSKSQATDNPTIAVQPPQTCSHFKLHRDDNVPLEFDGVTLGQVEDKTPSRGGSLIIMTRAALYQTRGGKYI